MKEDYQNYQYIREAYPNLPPKDAHQLAKDKEKVQYARNIVDKNEETHRIIRGYNQIIGLICFSATVPDDLSGLFNPCYRTQPTDESEKELTLIETLCNMRGFTDIKCYLESFSENDIRPWGLETVLSHEVAVPVMREVFFDSIEKCLIQHRKLGLTINKKDWKEQIDKEKGELDALFGVISDKFGSLTPLLKEIASPPKEEDMDKPQKSAPHQSMDLPSIFAYLLKNNMVNAAKGLINEAYHQKNYPKSVVDLISSFDTDTMFRETSLFSPPVQLNKEQRTILEVKRHLENKMPTNIFIELVEHKDVPPLWSKDFER